MAKKLIEVAFPLAAINEGARSENENPFLKGHPRAVHNWWARTPLSVSRAILFAQLIDDPFTSQPNARGRKKRAELLKLTGELGQWAATSDEKLLSRARAAVDAQFKGNAPEFWDMFAGRGSLPIEAQRLGLRVTASDVNPVAVVIERAVLEFPARFRDRPPVYPDQRHLQTEGKWRAARGLAEDVRLYAEEITRRARVKLASCYPAAAGGQKIFAWFWARTVTCPNPACRAPMPLLATLVLSRSRRIWLKPIPTGPGKPVRFRVETGKGTPPKPSKIGRGAKFKCLTCDQPAADDHIKSEGVAGRMSAQLVAMVTDRDSGRMFLDPDAHQAAVATGAKPTWAPEEVLADDPRSIWCPLYGLTHIRDLFTNRQLVALTTYVELIREIRPEILRASGDDAYAHAIMFYLACALSRLTDYSNGLCTWNATNENISHLFQQQGIPMAWDFAEANALDGISLASAAAWVASGLENLPTVGDPARVLQLDARGVPPKFETAPIISTDPPYYDNIGYADLSDFFYVWLRHVLRSVDPQTFATVLTPKEPELIASPTRHGGSKDAASRHFREGFAQVSRMLHETATRDAPLTIYYAFREVEEERHDDGGMVVSSTGWETMLEGLVDNGFQVTGTWPVRTTKRARSVAQGTNALASAVVLVARHKSAQASLATKKDFVAVLRKELPTAVAELTEAGIAPVDLSQSLIGPGMAVYSRYAGVLEAEGGRMSVRTALQIINQELSTFLEQDDTELDRETRFCLEWSKLNGLDWGDSGDGEIIARAKGIAVRTLEQEGIVEPRGSKLRLVARDQFDADWNPLSEERLPIWTCTQHLARALNQGGVAAAGKLSAALGPGRSQDSRALAYRLFVLFDRRHATEEALAFNTLVTEWSSIQEQAAQIQNVGEQRRLGL